ncbi:hypothetical protein [Pseudomonas graminis]|uniref:hypothetical protein n=1 Tax=Pseudomonas graminis TaxID=158627 RepID=UPI003C1783EA
MKGFVPANLIGIYVNADDIEHDVKATGFLDLSIYKIHTTPQILHSFVDQFAARQIQQAGTGEVDRSGWRPH